MSSVQAWALPGLPEVRPGDDLAALLRDGAYEPGDVLVIAHKVVSKSEGALRALDAVTVVRPRPRAGRASTARTRATCR